MLTEGVSQVRGSDTEEVVTRGQEPCDLLPKVHEAGVTQDSNWIGLSTPPVAFPVRAQGRRFPMHNCGPNNARDRIVLGVVPAPR